MSAERLEVHQALHGYADGHRLIASSLPLQARDEKAMLVLSDVSGPGARINRQGYLTGYPLPDSGFYAFARTWAAPEMPRPGCVWTHTLLLDFADLASVALPGSLDVHFRRPAPPLTTGYDVPLRLPPPRELPPTVDPSALQWLRQLLAAVYGHPTDKIIGAQPAEFDPEPLVLLLWAQQWPRLRRSFRFCTLAAADRSEEVGPFDLQLLPFQDRSARSLFIDAVDVERVVPESSEWLNCAFDDLRSPSPQGLREFLRQLGGDVPSGRSAFVPLCQLYSAMQDPHHGRNSVSTAISLLEGPLASPHARAARMVVARRAAEQVSLLDNLELAFVLRHLDLLDLTRYPERADVLAEALWVRDPHALLGMLDGDQSSRLLAERALETLPADDLLAGLQRTTGVIDVVISHRPELLGSPAFWRLEEASLTTVLAGADSPSDQRSAITAMIEVDRFDLAQQAVERFGASAVLPLVTNKLDRVRTELPADALARWLSVAVADTSALAETLGNRAIRARTSLVAIARATTPDAVPNDYGIDPWLAAIEGTPSPASQEGTLDLASYLLCRALGHRSRNPAELAAFSFEPVYTAAARSELSVLAWRWLDQRLPGDFFFFDWDRCERLRRGVVGLFVERELPPSIFVRLAMSDDLFRQLAERAGKTGRGRQYLRGVRRALNDADKVGYAKWIRFVDDIAD